MGFKRILGILLTLVLCSPLASPAQTSSNGQVSAAAQSNLTVQIRGIRSNRGVIRVALFRNKQTYDSPAPAQSAYRRAILPIKNNSANWQLEVPYGIYGIKLFHDEDNSGKLKKSFVGRPTEGVGFSNNPKVTTHAPSFDEVKFQLGQPQQAITINMINP